MACRLRVIGLSSESFAGQLSKVQFAEVSAVFISLSVAEREVL